MEIIPVPVYDVWMGFQINRAYNRVLERLVDKPFTKIWHHNLTAEQFKYNFLSKLLSEKEAQGVV